MTGNPVGIPDECGCSGPSRGLPCGCCAPGASPTPRAVTNEPGLPAIRYRVGTYAAFRQAMLDGIRDRTELSRWTSRRDDDWGIAVLDMWAYVADVLTFHQERIANEAYLRTATRRGSVIRLAALLDYRLGPGRSASAHLAFVAEKGKQVRIPAGLRVQSVPGQDEKPQKFEVEDALLADWRLNAVRIHGVPETRQELRANGTWDVLAPAHPAPLAPGERMLVLVASSKVEVKEVVSVVASDSGPVLTWAPALRTDGSAAHKLLSQHPLLGPSVPAYTFNPHYTINPADATPANPLRPTGYAAVTYAQTLASPLVLDGVHKDIAVGARVVLTYPSGRRTGRVTDVTHGSMPFGGTSVPTTEVSVDYDQTGGWAPITDTKKATLYVVGPPLSFAGKVYPQRADAIQGLGPIVIPVGELRRPPVASTAGAPAPPSEGPDAYDLLAVGRAVVLDDKEGKPAVVTLASAAADPDGKHLVVTFTPALARPLDPATATLRGNVAKATHGETLKDEVLGEGNAARPFLRFRPSKAGLSHVPRAGAPRGAASTLRVRVNGVLWKEVPSLLEAAANAQAFETRMEEDGTTVVQFGDGETGARVPTGRKNVVATYRVGVGKPGNVRADTLANLLDKPVGLKGSTNPLRAQGGADPESTDNARRLAPMKVRTFGRIVSLRDFEDAALDFAGVTKARATWAWVDGEQVVSLTVGGDPDAPLTDETVADLAADLDARRDPIRKMAPARYKDTPIALTLRVEVDPRHDPAVVALAVRRALHDALAYERTSFGQPVDLSDVYHAAHQAEGMVAARVSRLRHREAAHRDEHGSPPDEVLPRVPIAHDRLASLSPSDLVVETTASLIPEE